MVEAQIDRSATKTISTKGPGDTVLLVGIWTALGSPERQNLRDPSPQLKSTAQRIINHLVKTGRTRTEATELVENDDSMRMQSPATTYRQPMRSNK